MNLLLDVCCGPCSTHVINELKEEYEVTLFFTNSNIYPKEEYKKRLTEAKKVAKQTNLHLIEDTYDHDEWRKFIKGFENEPEGGKRCELCFLFRLAKTKEFSIINGYDCFTTTLTVSPHKNSELINSIGKQLQTDQVRFIESNFKKKDGYKKSMEYSQKLNLYRQNYCGCEFSKKP